MHLLSGKKIAADIRARVKEDVARLGFAPGLAVILVGDDPASRLYVGLKKKACAEAGIRFEKLEFGAQTSQEKIVATIQALNERSDIHAILVQLPLPPGFDTTLMLGSIKVTKDADGFLPGSPVTPPTVRGIVTLLEATGLPLARKKAAVRANSRVFREAIKRALRARGVIMTGDPLVADIVVSASGEPRSLRAGDIPAASIVIDVGSPRGDADLDSFRDRDGWITPVPGGVGPLTVACLLENVAQLARLTILSRSLRPRRAQTTR